MAASDTPTAIAIDRVYRSLASGRRRSSPLLCVVLAAEPFQGKSTIALNLAAAAARAGERTLLIDADRERTVATREAEATDKPGLAEVIGGSSACSAAIVKLTEPAVDLLPAGRLTDLKPSRAMLDRVDETLVGSLASYDVVIVDAARAGHDRLTQALVGRADACLLVAQEGSAHREAVDEAVGWLESTTAGETRAVLVRAA